MAKYLLATFSFKPILHFQKYEPVFTHLRWYSVNPSNLTKISETNNAYVEKPRWNDQDTDKLINLVKEQGRKWALFTCYFPGRTAESIRQHHLSVNSKYNRLTTEEKNIIQSLVENEKSFEEIDWQHIQQSLPNRKSTSVIQRYYRSIHPSVNKGKWTDKEIRQLLDLVGKHGKDWTLVSEQMETRSEDQCSQKYAYEMNRQNVKTGRFSKEEDEALLNAVNKYGTESFYKIKKEINSNRSCKQLKDRYYNHLDPTIDKSPWTQEEKNKVFSLYAELKSAKLVKEKLNSKRSLINLRDRMRTMRKKQDK